MNPSIRSKLERIAERFSEVMALLSEADTQTDQNRFRDLGREYAQLEPLMTCYRHYLDTERDLAAAEEMLADAELAALARDEIAAIDTQRATLEGELQQLLIPPDPNDQCNSFLEIRAGTGGAEAALFAADLLRM